MNPMHWLLFNWRHFMPTPLANVSLTLVAALCGAIIGLERQKHEKAAGLRTFILVSLGSAAFTMAGFAFTSSTGDSGRVAAQIVTGIGFLGAGLILHSRGAIIGATTAATIWVMASIGMLAGAGFAAGALGLTLLVRFVLGGIAIYEYRLNRSQPPIKAALDFDPSGGRTRVRIERILIDYNIDPLTADWISIDPTADRLTLVLRLPRHHLRELLDDLVGIPEVTKVHQENVPTTAG
jgi:putative Mg2+ transporter-C (MgtC) family protein